MIRRYSAGRAPTLAAQCGFTSNRADGLVEESSLLFQRLPLRPECHREARSLVRRQSSNPLVWDPNTSQRDNLYETL